MWAQVDMNEFYKQFEGKRKRTHCIIVNLQKEILRALFYDILIITVLEFIAEQLSYSFS